ncbi:hypothetical protein ACFYW8_10785 [Streptomyces sp. NPDC002742]|uniref:hypothetical protein n=1 Tax=Streptomyces sp. NPDC002742 TaxID=3364663 RepID=UPI0036AF9319
MADTLAVLAARIATLERLVRDLSRTSRLANSSIENGSIAVYDDGGLLRGSIGIQPDGTVALAAVNGPTPPVPTAPTTASVRGGVAVSWDGKFTNGSQAPADFASVEVHFSTSADFPDGGSLFAAFYSAQGQTMTVPAGGPVWVRLVCVSTSGKASEPSAAAGPAGPSPVVAQEVLAGVITELSLADGAVTRAKIEAEAVDGTALADGAVTTPKLVAGEIDGLVLAAGTVTADRLVAASITAAQIKALSVTGDRLVANTVTADQLAVGTITAASGVISSIDATVITVGKIKATQIDATNLVISGANVNGTVTAATTATTATTAGAATTVTGSIGSEVLLPPTQMGTGQIPQTTTINGGSIVTGTLDAAAIKAGTITVDRLAVGLAGQVGQKWYDFGDAASKWQNLGGTMTTVAVPDSQSGGNVMRCVGYVQGAYRPDVKIPFDPSVTYRVGLRIRQTVANSTPGQSQTLYAGVAGLAGDGVTFVNNVGDNSKSSQFYVAVDSEDLVVGADWVTYNGYLKGTSAAPVRTTAPNANAPAQLHSKVRYITPFLYANYQGGTGTVEIDMYAIEVVESGGITASNIKAGAIDGQTITGATLQTANSGNRIVLDEETIGGVPTGVIRFKSGQSGDTDGLITSEVNDAATQLAITAPKSSLVTSSAPPASLLLGTDAMGKQIIEFDAEKVYLTSPTYVALPLWDYLGQGVIFNLVKDWTTPALATGYTGNGNSNGTVQYRVINVLGTNFVQWRGGLSITYSSGAIANSGAPFSSALPTAARPSSKCSLSAACSAAGSSTLALKVDFNTDGSVSIIGTNTTTINPPWVSFSGLMYSL